MSNPFDGLAKKSDSPGKKKSDVVAAVVPKKIAKNIDEFVAIKATVKSGEADLKVLETEIIECLREQQDTLAYAGQFTKSLAANGLTETVAANGLTETARITYVTSDRFSVPQDEASLTELKKITGPAFDNMFETKRVITMKKDALENETLLMKIATACEKAGMPLVEAFDVCDKVIAKSGLDEKQYSLPKDKLSIFRTLVKQNKPALK